MKRANIYRTTEGKSGKRVHNYKEGLISFSINFGGERFVRSHQLTESEVNAIKFMLKDQGEASANSAIMRQLFNGTKMLVEAVMSRACMDYIKKNHVPKEEKKTVFDSPAEGSQT